MKTLYVSFGSQLNLFLDLVLMVYFHHVPVFNIKTENEERPVFILLCAPVPIRHPRIATALIQLGCLKRSMMNPQYCLF